MDKRWSKTEIAYLKRQAKNKTPEELAQRFHTDAEAVLRKLGELGLVESGGVLGDEPFLQDYEAAVRHLGEKSWKKARALLQKILDQTDSRRLQDRARQGLEICSRHLDAAVDGEDPYLRAVVAKNRGELDEAVQIAEALPSPTGDERSAYLFASLHALRGEADRAVELLETAIAMEPKNRVHAFHDPDFEPIRTREEFRRLVLGR